MTGVTFFYTPDTDNYGETWTVEGSLGYEFQKVGIFTPSVSGLVGYAEALGEDADGNSFFGDSSDYTYWNAGLSLGVENFTMDFRYWDTNIDNEGTADECFVFLASVTVP